LLGELFLFSSEFASQFVETIAYRHSMNLFSDPQEEIIFSLVKAQDCFLKAFLYFITQLFRVISDHNLPPPPPLDPLFSSDLNLSASIVTCLCDCVITIGSRIGHFPYTVDWTTLRHLEPDQVSQYRMNAENLYKLPPVELPAVGRIPWLDWGVRSLNFFPSRAQVVIQKPERIPLSQTLVSIDKMIDNGSHHLK
jgi:hypothetical protein